MTWKKGFAGGPFQLLISVIVFGMVLAIGSFLFDNMQCWKCNEMLKMEATKYGQAIASVGKGDVNSRKVMVIRASNMGYCFDGIYLKKIKYDAGKDMGCKEFCPEHPQSCWVVIPRSTCGDKYFPLECVDISSDITITTTVPTMTPLTSGDSQTIDSFPIRETVPIQIKKVSPDEIQISPS